MGPGPKRSRAHPAFALVFSLFFVFGFIVVGFFVLGHRHVLAAVRAGKLRSIDISVVNYERFTTTGALESE